LEHGEAAGVNENRANRHAVSRAAAPRGRLRTVRQSGAFVQVRRKKQGKTRNRVTDTLNGCSVLTMRPTDPSTPCPDTPPPAPPPAPPPSESLENARTLFLNTRKKFLEAHAREREALLNLMNLVITGTGQLLAARNARSAAKEDLHFATGDLSDAEEAHYAADFAERRARKAAAGPVHVHPVDLCNAVGAIENAIATLGYSPPLLWTGIVLGDGPSAIARRLAPNDTDDTSKLEVAIATVQRALRGAS
jgi:hypothetical protein